MFSKQLNKSIHKCFKKIRIKNEPKKEVGSTDIQCLLNYQTHLQDLVKSSTREISLSLIKDQLLKIDIILENVVSRKNKETVIRNMEMLIKGR